MERCAGAISAVAIDCGELLHDMQRLLERTLRDDLLLTLLFAFGVFALASVGAAFAGSIELVGHVQVADTPGRHEPGAHSVLGVSYAETTSNEQGLAVLEGLSRHPATAAFVARKLVKLSAIAAPVCATIGLLISWLLARTQFAGQRLFDQALSGTNGRACATCHPESDHTTLLPASVVARLAGLDRRHVDEQGAGAHGLCGARMEQHMLYRWTVFQQAHHDVSLPYRLCDGGMHSNAQRCQRIGFGLGAVPGVHGMPGLLQAACHGTSHHADTENGDTKRRIGHAWFGCVR